MGMKGISPLIATVLLIAFTIAIAGIVSVFFTSFTKQTTGSVNSQGQNLVTCAGSAPTVDQVKYSLAGTGLTNVTYSNPGSYNLTNITIYTTLSNAVTYINSSGTLSGNFYLNPLSSNSTTLLAVSGATPTEVRVVGYCQSTQAESGSCIVGQSCMVAATP